MKHGHRWLIGVLVAAGLVVALALIATGGQDSLAANGTIYVDADAMGANNGTSWEDAFTDLQLALDEAVAGDEIWVAEGIYTPTSGTDRYISFQMMNGVAICGGFDPTVGDDEWEDRDWEANPTILSGDLNGDDGPDFANNGENSYHVFDHGWGTDLDGSAILDGITVTGGNANGDTSTKSNIGGGMYNYASSPTLINCTFRGNSAISAGGGMYNTQSSPVLTNCTFSRNSANAGGGLFDAYSSSPTLTNCKFEGNSVADHGGGMFNASYSSPTLINCTFEGNSAGGLGGAICDDDYCSTVLTGCTFEGNTAYTGGGMVSLRSSPVLTNCTFAGNTADYEGGGMLNDNSSPKLTNCILWGDNPNEIASAGTSPVATYSDIQGGFEGVGNIDADPRFVDPDNGDFHLGLDSPCIDVGNNEAPNLPLYDFEGHPRIMNGDGDGVAIVDMGVDEVFGHRLYLPLVLRSCLPP